MLRLREIRKARGLTLAEVGAAVGTTEVSMSRYEREPQRVTVPLLEKLAKALDSSIAEICGESPGFAPEADHPPAYNGELEPGIVEIGHTEFAAIARFDMALSAGPGAILDPHAEPLGYHLVERQWLAAVTRAAPAHLAILRVDGDSMRPTLEHGDWLLVDRSQRRLNVEGVYAITVGDVVWVKRLSLNLRDRLVRIVSDNPQYPVNELAEDELAVIGRVVRVVWRGI